MSISPESGRPDVPAPQPGSVTRDESSQSSPSDARPNAVAVVLELTKLTQPAHMETGWATFSTKAAIEGGYRVYLELSLRWSEWQEAGRPVELTVQIPGAYA